VHRPLGRQIACIFPCEHFYATDRVAKAIIVPIAVSFCSYFYHAGFLFHVLCSGWRKKEAASALDGFNCLLKVGHIILALFTTAFGHATLV